jgi:molybdate transport system substrate-binding protein
MAPGTDFVGLIPAELQFYNAFAGGVGTAAKEPGAAKALLKILTAPEAAAVMRTKGMEPGTPR